MLFCPEFIQMALNFEDCRQKWLQCDEKLVACKEVLTKTETERGALEVKLKHARNQVDVEIRRRQRAESDYEKLVGTVIEKLQYIKRVVHHKVVVASIGKFCYFVMFIVK